MTPGPAATPDAAAGPDHGQPPGFPGPGGNRLPLFALVGGAGLVVSVIPVHAGGAPELAVALGVFVALTLLVRAVPWHRLPSWLWLSVPVGYIGVVALVRDAQGGSATGIGVLYLLPMVWIAFYGRRSDLVAGLVALAAALVVPLVAVGTPEYPGSSWRGAVLTVAVAGLVSGTVLIMVARDRDYLADLAQQSVIARRSARHAVTARAQLDSLLRAATETAIIGADATGVVTFFSAGAERMLGYAAADVVGHLTVYDLVDPVELDHRRTEVDALVHRTREEPAATVHTEGSIWTFRRADGTTGRASVAVTNRPDPEAEPGFVVVAGDVTERELLALEQQRLLAVQREVTQALVEQNRRLRELTQMKDDVVSTVSHELRTPLTSINGFIELLLEDAAHLGDDQVRMLRTIERNCAQLLRVAEDLLADPGGTHSLHVDFVETDLTAVAAGAVDAARAHADGRRLELVAEPGRPPLVHGDPRRLSQLLDNLLSNALKFSGPEGRVAVMVRVVGSFAEITVCDDGPGVPTGERSQLFERFYRLASTADRGIPGSGLGLAIAKSVAEAHDGTVDIVDTPGWSTTFRVLLPLAEGVEVA